MRHTNITPLCGRTGRQRFLITFYTFSCSLFVLFPFLWYEEQKKLFSFTPHIHIIKCIQKFFTHTHTHSLSNIISRQIHKKKICASYLHVHVLCSQKPLNIFFLCILYSVCFVFFFFLCSKSINKIKYNVCDYSNHNNKTTYVHTRTHTSHVRHLSGNSGKIPFTRLNVRWCLYPKIMGFVVCICEK